jgi:hypothetical protein
MPKRASALLDTLPNAERARSRNEESEPIPIEVSGESAYGMLLLVPADSFLAGLNPQIDGGVLVFTIGLSALTALATGILPALQHSRMDPAGHLQQASRGSSLGRRGRRVNDVLVVVEVALSLALLAGAGLLLTSLVRLQSTALGFDPDRVLTLKMSLSPGRYSDVHAVDRFYTSAVERLAGLTGVERCGAISSLPLSEGASWLGFVLEGQSFTNLWSLPFTRTAYVLGDYFRILAHDRRQIVHVGVTAQSHGRMDGPATPQTPFRRTAPGAVVAVMQAVNLWNLEDASGKARRGS